LARGYADGVIGIQQCHLRYWDSTTLEARAEVTSKDGLPA